MRLFLDSTVLVDVERRRSETATLLESATRADAELGISVITVSEILLGAYLRRDAERAVLRAKEALGQFVWKEFDGDCADKAAQLMAYLRSAGRPIEYPDVAIAACFLASGSDHLVTENKAIAALPPLEGRVFTAKEERPSLRAR